MSDYRYAVKVRLDEQKRWGLRWWWQCQGCTGWSFMSYGSLHAARDRAAAHAATCQALHWENWAACCPSCKAYGRVAPACPVCLGYGFEREREGLE